MNEVLRHRIQRHREAVLGRDRLRAEAAAASAPESARDAVQRNFARHVSQHREQQQQQEPRELSYRERALRLWAQAANKAANNNDARKDDNHA